MYISNLGIHKKYCFLWISFRKYQHLCFRPYLGLNSIFPLLFAVLGDFLSLQIVKTGNTKNLQFILFIFNKCSSFIFHKNDVLQIN